MKIRKVALEKATVKDIFAAAESQADYLLNLYKAVFPYWDDIVKIEDWPKITSETNRYIMQQAMKWDAEHGVRALLGGSWMNQGFSSVDVEGLEDWVVYVDEEKVEYKTKRIAVRLDNSYGIVIAATEEIEKAQDERYWPDYYGESELELETEVVEVPETLAEELCKQGLSTQHFADGYEAWGQLFKFKIGG